jgi:hypothetical protein
MFAPQDCAWRRTPSLCRRPLHKKIMCVNTLWIVVGEGAEILLSAEEDLLVSGAQCSLGAWFSPIPTIRHLKQGTVDHYDESSCGAFHNSTALITTTSFILSKNHLMPCCGDCGCEKALLTSREDVEATESGFPRISTGFSCAPGFILLIKASTVRQR